MKTTLEELFYDNEGLAEKIHESEEFKKVHNEYCKLYEKLLETLNEEQKKMLDDLFFLTGGLEAETAITHFKEGFKLCMRLVLEGAGK